MSRTKYADRMLRNEIRMAILVIIILAGLVVWTSFPQNNVHGRAQELAKSLHDTYRLVSANEWFGSLNPILMRDNDDEDVVSLRIFDEHVDYYAWRSLKTGSKIRLYERNSPSGVHPNAVEAYLAFEVMNHQEE